jgi:cytochrome c5
MCTRSVESKCAALLTALAALGVADSAGAQGYPAKFDFGVPASAEDIATVAIAIRPDGQGLPAGKGDYAMGKKVYETTCSACHGENLQGVA